MHGVLEFAQRLGSTPLSIWIQSHLWITPLLQAIHILMIGVVFVSVLMIMLRILGRVRPDQPFEAVWKRFAPWMWTGFCIMATTGIILTISEPEREAKALSFWLKMLLIAVGLVSVVALRRAVARHASSGISAAARVGAVAVLAVWIAIIFLGRAIAYDVEVWGPWIS